MDGDLVNAGDGGKIGHWKGCGFLVGDFGDENPFLGFVGSYRPKGHKIKKMELHELRDLLVEEEGKTYLPLLSHYAPDWWKRVIYTRTSCFEVVDVEGKMKVIVKEVSIVMDDLTALKCPPKKGMDFVERMIKAKWDGFVVREGKKWKEVVVRLDSDGPKRFPVVNGEATQAMHSAKRKKVKKVKKVEEVEEVEEVDEVEEVEVGSKREDVLTFKIKTSDPSQAIKKVRSAFQECGLNRYTFSKALAE